MASAPPTWDELYRRLPAGLRRYRLETAWSHERLWALELAVDEMPVAELAWQLALPWWRDGDRYFAVRPLDVLAAPERHPEQYARTLAAELAHPIEITLRHGRWFVLDGVHRLLKAVVLGRRTIAVRRLDAADLERIAARPQPTVNVQATARPRSPERANATATWRPGESPDAGAP